MEGKGNSPNSTQGSINLTDQPTWRKIAETKLPRRKFLQALGVACVGVLGIPACTSNSPKGEGPTLKSTPAVPTKEPTPIPRKDTVLGKTLDMGGSYELKQISGQKIADRIGARKRKLKIVVDNNGNSSCFTVFYTDENGRKTETVNIANGPGEFDWQGGSKPLQLFWQKDNKVFIPDAPLPGGWNGQYAGPVAIAESAHLAQDTDGNHKILFLYLKDTVEKLKAGNTLGNIEVLADGSGLFIIENQDYELKEGETIIREENNNLRLTQKDGSYKLMITSWQNVKSEKDLHQVRQFAGPIEANPNVSYPPEKLSQDAINTYAKAKGINPEQVRLTYEELKDKDGKSYVVATTSDVPLLTALMSEKGTWNWSRSELNESLYLSKGILLGTSLGGVEGKNTVRYTSDQDLIQSVRNNFGFITTRGQITPINIEKAGNDWTGMTRFENIAGTNLGVFLHYAFEPGRFASLDTEAEINERIDRLLDLVMKNGQTTYINFMNEPTDGGQDPNKNPLIGIYGSDWLAKLYVNFYKKALERKLDIGKNVVFVCNEWINLSNPDHKETKEAYDIMKSAKQKIASILGIDIGKVQFDVGLQAHLSPKGTASGPNHQLPPSSKDLASVLDLFGELGNLHITEVDVKDASPEQRAKIIGEFIQDLASWTDSRRKQNTTSVKTVTLTNNYLFDPNTYKSSDEFDYGPTGLFEQDAYTPTIAYYQLLKAILGS